jgi:hypothetical protein
MRGSDARTGELFSCVDLEKRVPCKHPLRLVRDVVNEVHARPATNDVGRKLPASSFSQWGST